MNSYRRAEIDITTERIVSFAEAARHLPRRRNGRRPHRSTFYRWAAMPDGLEVVAVGGQLCTSLEALARFINRLTENRARAKKP